MSESLEKESMTLAWPHHYSGDSYSQKRHSDTPATHAAAATKASHTAYDS